ncbi:hypothetical protein Ga0100231_023245 [Opitutaceae bacterium TAV4]|nr:hypothetical protein Ga0100231_023245 [Opitutaceae bacterium TAV4]RRK02472.1 hypothetical protein Ga0100230_004885 [Opitutaceae bacterium TAV3]
MKDRRFKELINLYLDNEISMSEAAELEAELHCNPVRREEYHDYCRLQRGCSTLFETECSRAPASFALHRALRDAERRIERPASSAAFWQRRQWWAYGSAAAVAASLVLVVVRLQQNPDGAAASAQYAATAPALEVAPGGSGEAPPLVVAVSAPSPVRPSHGTLRGISVPGWVLVAAHDANRQGELGVGSSRLALGVGEPVINLPEPAINADLDHYERAVAYEPVSSTGLRGSTSALGAGSGYKVEMTSYQFQR